MAGRCTSCSRGVALLALLVGVAVLGTVAASSVQIGVAVQRRAAERELLFVGSEFQRALASFAAVSPVGSPRGPRSLDELVRDPRVPGVRRHLRRIYVDPVTRSARWGEVRGPDGVIVAVHSLSEAAPLQRTGFEPSLQQLEGRERYNEWLFGNPSPQRP